MAEMGGAGQDKLSETSFWNRVASERIYAAFDKEEYVEVIDRTLGVELSGRTVIDVGSASGISAALFAARGANVIGIDISPALVEQARTLWSEYADRLRFAIGDAENLEVADATADACFFGGVLHHFPDCEGVYSEALRVLRPGGRFVAIEPNRLDWFERVEWAVADLRGKLSPNEYPIAPFRMKSELRLAGFRDIRFWLMRRDIPVLAQIPLLKRGFSRQKGFWLKRPVLRFVDAFRGPESRGTFFVMTAQKAKS